MAKSTKPAADLIETAEPTYRVIEPLQHDGVEYRPGDIAPPLPHAIRDQLVESMVIAQDG